MSQALSQLLSEYRKYVDRLRSADASGSPIPVHLTHRWMDGWITQLAAFKDCASRALRFELERIEQRWSDALCGPEERDLREIEQLLHFETLNDRPEEIVEGPISPYSWRHCDGRIAAGCQPRPWTLLHAVWKSKGRSLDWDRVGDLVYQDAEEFVDPDVLRYTCRHANDWLKTHSIPWHVSCHQPRRGRLGCIALRAKSR